MSFNCNWSRAIEFNTNITAFEHIAHYHDSSIKTNFNFPGEGTACSATKGRYDYGQSYFAEPRQIEVLPSRPQNDETCANTEDIHTKAI